MAKVKTAEATPAYHPQATVTCACGHTFTVGSTVPQIHVEICSKCHPFYTGKQKLVDEGGRVNRYAKLAEQAAKVGSNRGGKKQRAEKRARIKASKTPKAERE